jgi:hypothetical protein
MQKEHWIIMGVITIALIGTWPLVMLFYSAFKSQIEVGFEVKDNQVYLVEVANGGLGNEKTPILGIDSGTFQAISTDDPFLYARDSTKVFFREQIIPGADPNTFRLLKGSFIGIDQASAYYKNKKIEGANPKTMQTLAHQNSGINYGPSPYSRDDQSVFFYEKKIESAIPSTFSLILFEGYTYDLAKDHNFIFYRGEVVPKSDSSSFHFLGTEVKAGSRIYAQDKNQVYLFDRKIKILSGADPKYFKLLLGTKNVSSNGDYWARSGDFIYYLGDRLTEVDAATFEVLTDFLAKDSKFVFFRSEKILGADPQTFEIVNEYFSRDARNVYFDGVAQPSIDRDSFKANGPYWKVEDKNGPIDPDKILRSELKKENQ